MRQIDNVYANTTISQTYYGTANTTSIYTLSDIQKTAADHYSISHFAYIDIYKFQKVHDVLQQ